MLHFIDDAVECTQGRKDGFHLFLATTEKYIYIQDQTTGVTQTSISGDGLSELFALLSISCLCFMFRVFSKKFFMATASLPLRPGDFTWEKCLLPTGTRTSLHSVVAMLAVSLAVQFVTT